MNQGDALRKVHDTATIRSSPPAMPIRGERKMKMIGLTHPAAISAFTPAFATAAPPYPPMIACEELEGSPTHHVIKSQTIAPNSPARMTKGSTIEMSIIPLPMVLATAVPNPKAATKLKKAAHATASLGESTRVDTTVAMLLALS